MSSNLIEDQKQTTKNRPTKVECRFIMDVLFKNLLIFFCIDCTETIIYS